jgi:hypothetical protein
VMTGQPLLRKELQPNGVRLMPPRALSGRRMLNANQKSWLIFARNTVATEEEKKHGHCWLFAWMCIRKVLGFDMRFTRERYPAALLSLEFQGESPVLSTLKRVCLTATPPLRVPGL